MDFIAELRNGWFTPEEFARVAVRLGTALIVGAVASLTVTVVVELITSAAPGTFTTTRYSAPVSGAHSVPVLKVVLVWPAVPALVHTPPPAWRCHT